MVSFFKNFFHILHDHQTKWKLLRFATVLNLMYKPAHDKTYNKTCFQRIDRVFADHLCACMVLNLMYKPAHDKTYNKICDQRRLCQDCASAQSWQSLRWSLVPSTACGYPKRDKQVPLSYWVDVHADGRLCWSHRSYCRFCRALAHLLIAFLKEYRCICVTSNYADTLASYHDRPSFWTNPFYCLLKCLNLLDKWKTVYTLVRRFTMFYQACLSRYLE